MFIPRQWDVPLGDLQGEVPPLTQSSDSPQTTMSEPAPVLQRAPNPRPSRAQRWTRKELKTDDGSPYVFAEVNPKENGRPARSPGSDVSPAAGGDVELVRLHCVAAAHGGCGLEPEIVNDPGATLPLQLAGSPAEAPGPHVPLPPAQVRDCGSHLSGPVGASEDSQWDVLRVVKHKPSAIVFSDYDQSAETRTIFANEGSDGGESSSNSTEEGVGDDDDDDEEDDDAFPETLQYKEFLISRRRRNLSRNRKGLRKRQDALCNGTHARQNPTNKSKAEVKGRHEEVERLQNEGKQVER